jgi:hypothetical protein
VRKLKLRPTILDGEFVAIDDEGIPRFQLLQKWQKQPAALKVSFLLGFPQQAFHTRVDLPSALLANLVIVLG